MSLSGPCLSTCPRPPGICWAAMAKVGLLFSMRPCDPLSNTQCLEHLS